MVGKIKIVEVNQIKKGGYLVVEGEAYRAVSIAHSKAGKHGSAKYRIDVVSVLGGKKISIVKGSGSKVEVPIIEKHNAQVLTIEDRVKTVGSEVTNLRIANVMDSDSYETFDLEIPDELKADVVEGTKIMYWDVLGVRVAKQIVS